MKLMNRMSLGDALSLHRPFYNWHKFFHDILAAQLEEEWNRNYKRLSWSLLAITLTWDLIYLNLNTIPLNLLYFSPRPARLRPAAPWTCKHRLHNASQNQQNSLCNENTSDPRTERIAYLHDLFEESWTCLSKCSIKLRKPLKTWPDGMSNCSSWNEMILVTAWV